MNTRILAPVAAVLAIGGAVTLAGDNDLISSAKAGSFELSVGQLKINQKISSAAVRRANKNRSDIDVLQQRLGSGGNAVTPTAGASGAPLPGGGASSGGTTTLADESGEGLDVPDGSAGVAPALPSHSTRAVLSTRKVMIEGTFGSRGLATHTRRVLVATCPRGFQLVGGGHSVGSKVTGDPLVRVSAPVDAGSNAWKVEVQRAGVPWAAGTVQQTRSLRAWATCLKVENILPIVSDE